MPPPTLATRLALLSRPKETSGRCFADQVNVEPRRRWTLSLEMCLSKERAQRKLSDASGVSSSKKWEASLTEKAPSAASPIFQVSLSPRAPLPEYA
jgi:hypothetical protein